MTGAVRFAAIRAEIVRALRERRASLLWTALAIVLGEAIAFAALGDSLTIHTADYFPGSALAIAGLALAIDLFGRDLRSGAHALVLRTPRAFRAVLVGRLLVLVAAMTAAVGLEAVLRAGLSAAIHPPRDFAWVVKEWTSDREPIKSREPLVLAYVLGLRTPFVAAGAAAAAVLWVALGSAWSRRRPPAALLGLLPLLAILASLGAIARPDSDFFPVMPIDAAILVGGGTALALGALAWGWLRARARLGGGFGCAARGLALILVVGLAADAALAATLSRWLDPRPGDDDVRIVNAVLGTSRRHLAIFFLRGASVYRPDGEPEDPHRSTPPFTWILDLQTGTWRDLGMRRRVFTPPEDTMGHRRALDPQPWIWCKWQGESWFSDWSESWIDGRTGEVRLERRPMSEDRAGPEVPVAWRREVRRANTPVRDAQGRRAWTFGLRVEREGEPTSGELPSGGHLLKPAPGGWFGPWGGNSGDTTGWAFLDANTGTPTFVRWQDDHFVSPLALGHSAVLRGVHLPGEKWERRSWVWKLSPIPSGPDRVVGTGIPWQSDSAVVAEGVVLVGVPRADPDGEQDLALWRPATDERRRLPIEGPPSGGWSWMGVAGRRSDGPWLVSLRKDPKTATPGVFYVLLDPVAPRATALTGWLSRDLAIVAVDDDGSLVAIEDERRIVRYGPAPGVRTVLFPREAPGR